MRAIWKGIPNKRKKNKRENMILPEWVGKSIRIETGKGEKRRKIEGEMVGRRVGEIVKTKERKK